MPTTQTPFIYPPTDFIVSSAGTAILDAAEEHIAGTFVIPHTGTLKKIAIRLNSVATPSLTLRIALETLDLTTLGVPVATSVAGSTLYVANATGTLTDPAAQVHWVALNGGSGVSVTKGDLATITVRVSAYNSGSVTLLTMTHFWGNNCTFPYTYTYLNSTGTASAAAPNFALQYDTIGCVPAVKMIPAASATIVESWASNSNPDRRGLRFKMPWDCTISGGLVHVDPDVDVDMILYDSDEYTVLETVALDKDVRYTNALGAISFRFDSSHTLTADTAYRLVCLPKDTTNINLRNLILVDDGATPAMAGLAGGVEWYLTEFNGAPNSGSHTWTNTTTERPGIHLFVDSIDTDGGGGGVYYG